MTFDVLQNRATALYIAVQEGRWEVVRQLMEHPQIDVDKPMQVNPQCVCVSCVDREDLADRRVVL